MAVSNNNLARRCQYLLIVMLIMCIILIMVSYSIGILVGKKIQNTPTVSYNNQLLKKQNIHSLHHQY